jgi:hypothetical protein
VKRKESLYLMRKVISMRASWINLVSNMDMENKYSKTEIFMKETGLIIWWKALVNSLLILEMFMKENSAWTRNMVKENWHLKSVVISMKVTGVLIKWLAKESIFTNRKIEFMKGTLLREPLMVMVSWSVKVVSFTQASSSQVYLKALES